MIGSGDTSGDTTLSPSQSATFRRKRLPALATNAIRVENTPFSPVSFSKIASAIRWAANRRSASTASSDSPASAPWLLPSVTCTPATGSRARPWP